MCGAALNAGHDPEGWQLVPLLLLLLLLSGGLLGELE
jgi:hypothetical protein